MLSIKEINNYNALKAMSSTWRELLSESELDNLFLTWEWVSNWIETFLTEEDRNSNLFVLIVYEDSKVVGIAPLYIKNTKFLGKMSIKQLGLIADTFVSSDYLGFIVKKKKEAEVIPFVLDYLFKSKLWQVAVFESIPASTLFLDRLISYLDYLGKYYSINNCAICPGIVLPETMDSLMNKLRRKKSYNIKRQLRRVENVINYKHYKTLPWDIEESIKYLATLHQERMDQKGLPGSFSDSRFKLFHNKVAKVFAEKNLLRLNFFLREGKPIAAFYGFRYRDRYYHYSGGMITNDLKDESLGTLILYQNIKDAIQEGCNDFDMLRGNERYKFTWANHYIRTLRVNFFRRHIKTITYVASDEIKNFVKLVIR